jgi:hypothetical protein
MESFESDYEAYEGALMDKDDAHDYVDTVKV